MAKRISQKEIRKFLSERKLTRSFNTWRSFKGKRKRVIEIVSSNYDGTQSRSRVYAVKTRYGTSFRDFVTLRVLGKSRSKPDDAIKKINSFKNVSINETFNGKEIVNKARINEVKLKNVKSVYSYNKSEQRLREMRKTNTVIRNKVGSVGCDIEVRKAGAKNFRMRVRSRFGILNTKKQREAFIDENIRLVSGKAGYTPDEIIIHEIWYEYWLDKQEKLSRIK